MSVGRLFISSLCQENETSDFMLRGCVDWWKHSAHQSRLGLARTHGVFFSTSIVLDSNNNTKLNTVLPSVVHPNNTNTIKILYRFSIYKIGIIVFYLLTITVVVYNSF